MDEARLAVVTGDAEALAHRIEGDPVDVVEVGARLYLVEAARRLDIEVVERGEAGGGEVVEALASFESEVEGEGGERARERSTKSSATASTAGRGSLFGHDLTLYELTHTSWLRSQAMRRGTWAQCGHRILGVR